MCNGFEKCLPVHNLSMRVKLDALATGYAFVGLVLADSKRARTKQSIMFTVELVKTKRQEFKFILAFCSPLGLVFLVLLLLSSEKMSLRELQKIVNI